MKSYNSTKQNLPIMETVLEIIKTKGLKSSTMDIIANRLQMSKRTLYELYGSKDNLLNQTLEYFNQVRIRTIHTIFQTSETAIEALYKCIQYHLHLVEGTCIEFFHDLDSRNKEYRDMYERNNNEFRKGMTNAVKLGVKQGVFRPDIDYNIAIQMFMIQIESLKRMEEFFPPEITISNVQSAIGVNFLRAIATIEGVKILDDYIKNNPNEIKQL